MGNAICFIFVFLGLFTQSLHGARALQRCKLLERANGWIVQPIDALSLWCQSGCQMNVTIKHLPTRLHRKLKARAEANKRSLNWEVIDILEKAVESTPVDVDQLLAAPVPRFSLREPQTFISCVRRLRKRENS